MCVSMKGVKVKVKQSKEKQPADRDTTLSLGELKMFLDFSGKEKVQCQLDDHMDGFVDRHPSCL